MRVGTVSARATPAPASASTSTAPMHSFRSVAGLRAAQSTRIRNNRSGALLQDGTRLRGGTVKLLRRVGTRSTLVLAAAAILAVGITSIATGAAGSFVRIGKRNAAPGTTAIVGSTTGFSTRESNNTDGDGGAASYGCRADTGKEACLFVLNHHNGRIFEFRGTGGTVGGTINLSPPSGKTAKDVAPFTTNATGVATGLNADQVDGQGAGDIVDPTNPPFAAVNADGTVAGSRGLAQSNAVQRT